MALDGQGPTYPDAAESLAAAEAQVRALAVERDAPQPA